MAAGVIGASRTGTSMLATQLASTSTRPTRCHAGTTTMPRIREFIMDRLPDSPLTAIAYEENRWVDATARMFNPAFRVPTRPASRHIASDIA